MLRRCVSMRSLTTNLRRNASRTNNGTTCGRVPLVTMARAACLINAVAPRTLTPITRSKCLRFKSRMLPGVSKTPALLNRTPSFPCFSTVNLTAFSISLVCDIALICNNLLCLYLLKRQRSGLTPLVCQQ